MKSVPKLINKLKGASDRPSADILQVIRDEETHHFVTGRKWFTEVCKIKGMSVLEGLQRVNEALGYRLTEKDLMMEIQ